MRLRDIATTLGITERTAFGKRPGAPLERLL
jgi:hypothetical protein